MRLTAFMRSTLVAITFILMATAMSAANSASVTEPFITGTKHTIHSEILNDDRSMIIRLPEGYDATAIAYPVLYLLDAEYFHHIAHAALQFLSECGYLRNQPVPQMILVSILDEDRNRDFTPTHAPVQGPARFPTSGGADVYLRHLEKELIPYVDSHFRTQPYRVLAGWSLGGLFTVYTFLERRDLFANYIAMSPSMWWDNQYPITRANEVLVQGERLKQKLVITQGSNEVGGIPGTVKGGIVPLLRQKEVEGWEFIEIPDQIHVFVPYQALYAGLTSVYQHYPLTQEAINGGLDGVKAHYRKLSDVYGYSVPMTSDGYQQAAGAMLSSHDPAEILPVTEEWTALYPHVSHGWSFRGRINRMLERNEAARECYQRALDLELAKPLPDSEWILPIRSRLEELQ